MLYDIGEALDCSVLDRGKEGMIETGTLLNLDPDGGGVSSSLLYVDCVIQEFGDARRPKRSLFAY